MCEERNQVMLCILVCIAEWVEGEGEEKKVVR